MKKNHYEDDEQYSVLLMQDQQTIKALRRKVDELLLIVEKWQNSCGIVKNLEDGSISYLSPGMAGKRIEQFQAKIDWLEKN